MNITFIDLHKATVLDRGHPIEQLAEHSTLLKHVTSCSTASCHGPAARGVRQLIVKHTMVHEQLTRSYSGFRCDAHPMAVMVGVVGALSAFYDDSSISKIRHSVRWRYPHDRENADHRRHGLQIFAWPAVHLSEKPAENTGNFLHMCFAVPCEEYEVDPALASAMRQFFLLHADDEQSASTATVRLAGSSGANPYACISAGIASLWGPVHGGANEAVLLMLKEIGTVARIPEYIKRAKDKSDPFRLMGFGYRVYKNYDPRARSCRRPATRCSKLWVVTIARIRSSR